MKSAKATALLVTTFALTIFLSAFLLFEVQPILSKYILPWFGGSPAVWTTCMVFFQTVLFAGYAYAHFSQRAFSPRMQAVVHLLLLIAAVALLPIAPTPDWKPTGDASPTWRILALLTVCVGLPYFVLSTTGPLVQAWFSRTFPGRSPYRLYALSNIGSLLALLSYPFYVEPMFASGAQANYWTWGFMAFAVLCALTAIVSNVLATRSSPGVASPGNLTPSTPEPSGPAPTLGRRLLWLGLPAFASFMLLATTNHVCQDVAVIPLLWIMPLSLYLLTFIISFDHERWYNRKAFALAAIMALCFITAIDQLINTGANVSFSFFVELGAYFIALFCLCMVCHGELVRLKPATKYLTSFYLMISAGGALGGLFVSLLAPVIFSTFFEWKIGMVVGGIIAACVALGGQSRTSVRRLYYLAPVLVLLFVGFNTLPKLNEDARTEKNISLRSFYGVSRVIEKDSHDPDQHRFLLYSGRIVHGIQFTDEAKHMEPNAYFGTETGGGRAFAFFAARPDAHVGIIGLGAGTMAAYAKPGQTFRFYEINPDMLKLANEHFQYLKECRGTVDCVLGDGRLSLEREPEHYFDLLIIDAFSGDAIPVHLLTKQAFDIYLRDLKPSGAIAMNISNRYLDLEPVVAGVGREFHLTPLRFSSEGNVAEGKFPAEWIVLTKNAQFITENPTAVECGEKIIALRHGFWTDDRSNLFEILK
jgi:hypothetical protein